MDRNGPCNSARAITYVHCRPLPHAQCQRQSRQTRQSTLFSLTRHCVSPDSRVTLRPFMNHRLVHFMTQAPSSAPQRRQQQTSQTRRARAHGHGIVYTVTYGLITCGRTYTCGDSCLFQPPPRRAFRATLRWPPAQRLRLLPGLYDFRKSLRSTSAKLRFSPGDRASSTLDGLFRAS